MNKLLSLLILLLVVNSCNNKSRTTVPRTYSNYELLKKQVRGTNIHHLSRFPLTIKTYNTKAEVSAKIWIDLWSLDRACNMRLFDLQDFQSYEFADKICQIVRMDGYLYVDSLLFDYLKKDYTLQIDNEVDSIYQKEGFDGVFSKYVEFDKELYFPMVKAKNEKQFSHLQYIFYQHKILTTYYDECYELGYVIYLINGDIYDRCVRIHPEVKLAFEKGSIIDE